MKHLVMAAILTTVAVMMVDHRAFGDPYTVPLAEHPAPGDRDGSSPLAPVLPPPEPGTPNGPPTPSLPADDPPALELYDLIYEIRPSVMAIPHVTDVEGNIDTDGTFVVGVEVDTTANLPAVQAVIPPTIDGFPVEFGADDDPIYIDIQ